MIGFFVSSSFQRGRLASLQDCVLSPLWAFISRTKFLHCSVATFATLLPETLSFRFCGVIFKFGSASVFKEYPCHAPCQFDSL